MKNLINDIEIGGVRDALDILAKAGDEDLFEKAKHQIGDSHPKWPQLKWTDLGGGKFGWRTGTGRGKRAKVADNAGQASTGNTGGNAGQASTSDSGSGGGTTSTSGNASQAKPAKKEVINTQKDTKPKVSPNMRKLIDAFRISSNKYTDPEKMSITTTPKGNWELRYDGKRVSVIGSLDIDRDEFDDLGITIEIPNAKKETTDTTKTETTKKEDKKLRPVGTGTNGPERRRKEDNDSNFSVPSGAKLTPKEQEQFNELVDKGFLISTSRYNDTSKMKIELTPKHNWRCYYDGKDTGVTIDGKLMSTALAKKIGIYQ